jgi:hypothetical protein
MRRSYRWLDRQPGSVRGAIMSVVIVVTVSVINVARTPGVGVGFMALFDLAWAGIVGVFLIIRYKRLHRRRVSLK